MIVRSEFGVRRWLSVVLAAASVVMLAAACGGKIDTSNTGDGGSTSCKGTISCPVCAGQTDAPSPTCVDGQWQCPVTKCAVVPTCTGAADCKCGTASCQDGQWVCGSCACPADLAGLEGTKCDQEGITCGGENCTNPCNFCHLLQCESGVWQSVEAFPEPCDDGGPITVDAGSPR